MDNLDVSRLYGWVSNCKPIIRHKGNERLPNAEKDVEKCTSLYLEEALEDHIPNGACCVFISQNIAFTIIKEPIGPGLYVLDSHVYHALSDSMRGTVMRFKNATYLLNWILRNDRFHFLSSIERCLMGDFPTPLDEQLALAYSLTIFKRTTSFVCVDPVPRPVLVASVTSFSPATVNRETTANDTTQQLNGPAISEHKPKVYRIVRPPHSQPKSSVSSTFTLSEAPANAAFATAATNTTISSTAGRTGDPATSGNPTRSRIESDENPCIPNGTVSDLSADAARADEIVDPRRLGLHTARVPALKIERIWVKKRPSPVDGFLATGTEKRV